MTIKTLKMVRFGPYINETEIDFEKFTGKVFLVSGDTGAGKTTIFDAICYALYDEPSGSLRKSATLRNQDSAKGAPSFVELKFTAADGKEYLVHRETRAIRMVGDKPVNMPADSVTLTDLSTSQVTKGVKNVNREVIRLTGFDRDSFIRVSILPQGEFDKFLNENSSQRRETLRNIFGTQLYECYADVVQSWKKSAEADAAAAADEFKKLMNRTLNTTDEDYSLSDCAEYEEKLRKLSEECSAEMKAAEENFNLTNEKLKENSSLRSVAESVNAALKSWDSAKAEKQRLDALKADYSEKSARLKRRELAAEAKPALDRRNKQQTTLAETTAKLSAAVIEEKQASKALAAAESQQQKAKQLTPEREKITADVSALDELLKKCAEADKAEEKMHLTENQLTEYQKKLTLNQSGQEAGKAAQEKCSAELTAAHAAAALYDAAAAEINSLSGTLERLSRLSDGLSGLDTLRAARDAAQSKCEKAVEQSETAKLELNSLQAKYFAGEAARLARKLKKGEKCPVCGSTEHPLPAPWTEDILTQQDLDEAEAAYSKAQTAQSRAERVLAEKEAGLAANFSNISAEYSAVMGCDIPETGAADSVSAKTAALTGLLTAAESRLHLSETARDSLPVIQKELEQHQKQQAELIEEQSRLTREISALQSRRAAEEATVKEMRSGLAGRDTDRLLIEKGEKLSRADEIDGIVSAAAEALAAAGRDSASAARAHTQLEEARASAEQELSAAQSALEAELKRCGFSSADELLGEIVSKDELDRLRADISEYENKCSAANARLLECESRLPEDRTPRSTEQFDIAEEKLTAELDTHKTALVEKTAEHKKLTSAAEELVKITEASSESIRSAAILRKLEEAVSGKSTERIAFETYMQMKMFEGVLRQANTRLEEMSGGRYSFELRRQNVRSNASEGLDINMIDKHSSSETRRDVSTLSGGERFMASFALAIGLSDYTLQKGVGRQSDMLFIDEGFSSLDSSSFSHALNVINGISAGKRMIGIVTHIEDIKQYFQDSQIVVRKGKSGAGSTVEVMAGTAK